MNQGKSQSSDLRAEYNRSDFMKLERGKYYERVHASANVAAFEPNSVAANKAPSARLKGV